jgi:hypothetical protein
MNKSDIIGENTVNNSLLFEGGSVGGLSVSGSATDISKFLKIGGKMESEKGTK